MTIRKVKSSALTTSENICRELLSLALTTDRGSSTISAMGISKKKSKPYSISPCVNTGKPQPLTGREAKRLITRLERRVARELRKNPDQLTVSVTLKYKKRPTVGQEIEDHIFFPTEDSTWVVVGVWIGRDTVTVHRPVFHHSHTVPRGWRRAHAGVPELKEGWFICVTAKRAGLEDI